MSHSLPVILVMLLSMAKLQKGDHLANQGTDKRWQTPDDVRAQTREALSYLAETGQPCRSVVLCYTTSLYHNTDEKTARQSHVEQHNRASAHKRKTQKLLQADGIAATVIGWEELLLGQADFEQARAKLVNRYRRDNRFRLAVQGDNPKRGGITDPVPAKVAPHAPQPVGDAPTAAELFVIEEAGVFQQLAGRKIVHPAIDPDSKIVLCYPGAVLASLNVLLNPTGRQTLPEDERNQPFVWLDTTAAPAEHHFAMQRLMTPELAGPEASPSRVASATAEPDALPDPLPAPVQVSQPQPLWRAYLKNAAAIALPVIVGAGLSWDPRQETESLIVEQNAYKLILTHRHPRHSANVAVFTKNFDGTLTGSEVGFAEHEPTRPAVFQDDIWVFPQLQEAANRITGQRSFETGCGGIAADQIAPIRSGVFKRTVD